ncbi:MAG: GNAT family N-acetyltransferase [Gammaproteobacteria bacterium]
MPKKIDFLIKNPETEGELEDYYLFRWKMLREPWNMSKESSVDNHEENSYHLIAINKQKEIVGSGRLHQISAHKGQIRYMAVKEDLHRAGIGSKIVLALEEEAIRIGLNKIILNARENAIKFYSSLGYSLGKPFKSDTGIPHKTMSKEL